ncbi:peptidase propeptide and YPEB domain protein [Clostridiales bacterium oral taxon 876 str. F0540]|nr:peptidase propeptide and YPEB domain protein [Clostridiales bacterium oral taxon 876 str. F0540]
MNRKVKITVISCFIFVAVSCITVVANKKIVSAEKNDIDLAKKVITDFNPNSKNNIKKIREKVQNNKKIYEMEDNIYFYDINPDGEIKTITKKPNMKTINTKISKIEAQQKSLDIFHKLTKKNESNYTVDTNEKTLDNNSIYTIRYIEKNEKNQLTGNFIIIDLFPDGELQNAVIKNEDTSALNEATKVSEDQAKEIIADYVKNHKVLSKFANTNNITGYEVTQTLFRGVNCWMVKVNINDPEFLNSPLNYYIDANTGKMIMNTEPQKPGFDPNPDIIKFLEDHK